MTDTLRLNIPESEAGYYPAGSISVSRHVAAEHGMPDRVRFRVVDSSDAVMIYLTPDDAIETAKMLLAKAAELKADGHG